MAPSPTGYFHVGSVRTTLFNYLFAKKHGGAFVLRIEDTDLERSDPKFEVDIFESIRWLGIMPDESPEVGGSFGPYRQSERISTYRKSLEELLSAGLAFYCPHSELELDNERKRLMSEGRPPVHICSERDASLEKGIIRFKTPSGRELVFNDLIRDRISFTSDTVGDFSLAKNLDTPLYNFAVVIDDATMQISHVIRGEEHIANTPRQILIQEALSLPRPEYAHLPLILGHDRSKLSKREGATSVKEFRDAGYLPEALVNFMALLGWNPGTDREIFSLAELERLFSLEHVQKSGAIFNTEKLDWMNGEYIRSLSTDSLIALASPFLPRDALGSPLLERIIKLEQPRLKKLSELQERTHFFFQQPEYDASLLRWKSMSDEDVASSLERSKQILEALLDADFSVDSLSKHFLSEIGAGDKGELLWPLRVALSGMKASPGPFEIVAILGKEESSDRIETAISKFKKK